MFERNIEYHGIFGNADILMIILLIGGFIIQGATEEFLWLAIAVSTILFIVPHWSSLFEGGTIYGVIGAANLVLISIIFSLLTIRFKSIWVACGLHSFWNAVLYCILGLNLSGNDETVTAIFNMQSVGENIWNGGAYGIEASIITTIVLALAVVLLILANTRKNRNR